MLTFHRRSQRGNDQIDVEPAGLIVAGWTGRDEAALRHHIEELAAIGVPRPSSMPVFYRNSSSNLTQADAIEVLGPDTSGEADPSYSHLPMDSGLAWDPITPIARPRPWGSRCPSSSAQSRSVARCGLWSRWQITGIGCCFVRLPPSEASVKNIRRGICLRCGRQPT